MNVIKLIGILLVSALAGCGTKPPDCADAETIQTIKEILIENTEKMLGEGTTTDDPDGLVKKYIDGVVVKMTTVVSEGYQADAKKRMCKATLTVTFPDGEEASRAIDYSTQSTVDKESSYVVEVQEFQPFVLKTYGKAVQEYEKKRWSGNWVGMYRCSGIGGATDGPAGPFEQEVTVVFEGKNATLNRTSRGGGYEKLTGGVSSFDSEKNFNLTGAGENSVDDKWDTRFEGQLRGRNITATGRITSRISPIEMLAHIDATGRALSQEEHSRECFLNLTHGAELTQPVTVVKQGSQLPATSPQANESISGRYSGTGEGDLEMNISEPMGDGTYKVSISTSAERCGGSVEGVAKRSDNKLQLIVKSDGEEACNIEIAMTGKTAEVNEQDGCMSFHGAACGFSGSLRRLK